MGLEPGLRVERELSRKGWDLEKKESILTLMARGGRSQNEKKKKTMHILNLQLKIAFVSY